MKQRIAVVGGGVSGIVAAYLLQYAADVTLFEAGAVLGGHTHTVVVPSGPDEGTAVDTGFIVLNDKNYPLLHRFLQRLNIRVRWSDMSFSYCDDASGLVYSGSSFNGLFADRRNLFSSSFYVLLGEIRRFCVEGGDALALGSARGITVGEYAKKRRYRREFLDGYLYPMVSAIWSCPTSQAEEFPAEALLHFFRNHGLLSLRDRPRWQTVVGGSHSYIKAFLRSFEGTVRTNAPVTSIERKEESVVLHNGTDETSRFDHVVLAVHADQALRLLSCPSARESRLLGAWSYTRNRGALHFDDTLLPPNTRAWASWNVRNENRGGPPAISYYMNRLQGFSTKWQYIVTYNSSLPIDPHRLIEELDFAHPNYTMQSLATQAELPLLNGVQRTYFCGSYFGYGFHEDAVRSAVEVARHFGVPL